MRNHVESMEYFILTSCRIYIILCSEDSFIFKIKYFLSTPNSPTISHREIHFIEIKVKEVFTFKMKDLHYFIGSDVYK